MKDRNHSDSTFTDENGGKTDSTFQKPSKGFGKGINDYLNHYITVSDAKAVAFLALNFIEINLLIKEGSLEYDCFPFGWVALSLLFLSIVAASIVLFPRLPRSSKGLIFWEDICERKSPTQYEKELAEVDENRIEHEYAHQNYYVSTALHKKMKLIRFEIILFLAGTLFTVLSFI